MMSEGQRVFLWIMLGLFGVGLLTALGILWMLFTGRLKIK
jgi:hypothetical protein